MTSLYREGAIVETQLRNGSVVPIVTCIRKSCSKPRNYRISHILVPVDMDDDEQLDFIAENLRGTCFKNKDIKSRVLCQSAGKDWSCRAACEVGKCQYVEASSTETGKVPPTMMKSHWTVGKLSTVLYVADKLNVTRLVTMARLRNIVRSPKGRDLWKALSHGGYLIVKLAWEVKWVTVFIIKPAMYTS